MRLTFHKIKRESIFCSDFDDFKKNNEIEFSNSGIIVIYAPNGTGKTSLSKVLKNDSSTECLLSIDDQLLNDPLESKFHIIEDQNGRNIIQGETKDFILGDRIRKEYQLKNSLDNFFDEIYKNLVEQLKTDFKITTIKNLLIQKITDENLKIFTCDIVNSKSRGKKIDRGQFVSIAKDLRLIQIDEMDESKLLFIINNYQEKEPILERILNLSPERIKNDSNIRKIEENDEAIKILERFDYLDECIICDSEIDRQSLLVRKKQNKEIVYQNLDEETKGILEEIIGKIDSANDPFSIKPTLLKAISAGKFSYIHDLQVGIQSCISGISKKINNLFYDNIYKTDLINIFDEYQQLIEEQLEFSEEDILFVQNFICDSIGKNIELKRDNEKNIKILLADVELLNKERTKLSLSNGEQNFISLAFELLKAKSVNPGIIVLDDPISSFDSIYKNKITYALIKFLESKRQIILTHSTEMIKLLEHQKNHCFHLYILNNTENEENGFIPINDNEQKILLYIYQLINLFREEIKDHVRDEKSFLISTIPFMRGYAQIINDKEARDKLTSVMHGYSPAEINVTEIYNQLFSTEIIKNSYSISIDDIISIETDGLEIINKNQYPLLNKTLRHTLTYLQTRLSVEKVLVSKYSINPQKCEMLHQIVNKAFSGENLETAKKRMFLFSRKTLLNEFNHFEVDMSIFQPAIDITDSALRKEKDDIKNFLAQL